MGILHGSAKTGDSRAVAAEIRRGADVNAPDKHGRLALVLAAQNGHTDVVRLLLDNGADVNGICIGGSSALSGEVGMTALMWATWTGRIETARLLLGRGASVNTKSVHGNTALLLAEGNGWSDIVEVLKQAGAKE